MTTVTLHWWMLVPVLQAIVILVVIELDDIERTPKEALATFAIVGILMPCATILARCLP